MTKNFMDYLDDSKKTFSFKIWVANTDLNEDQMECLERSLKKYKLTNISKPKAVPVQKNEKFFPGMGAVEMKCIDVDLEYPCNSTQVHDAIVRSGVALASRDVVVLTCGQVENEIIQDGKECTDEDDNQGKVGEKKISSFLKTLKSRQFDIAGGKTPKAKTSNDSAENNKSPVTATKRSKK